MFAEISERSDALALCGDLTNYGKTREVEILCEDLAALVVVIAQHPDHRHPAGGQVLAEDLHLSRLPVVGQVAAERQGVGPLRNLGEHLAIGLLVVLADVQVADRRQPQGFLGGGRGGLRVWAHGALPVPCRPRRRSPTRRCR